MENKYITLGKLTYDSFLEQEYTKYTDEDFNFIKTLNIQLNGQNILDVGCGIGRFSKKFATIGNNLVTAVDISPELIKKAKIINNHKNIIYITKDMKELQLTNKYSIICSLYTGAFGLLDTYQDNIYLLEKIFKGLKEDGHLILMFRNKDYYIKKEKIDGMNKINKYLNITNDNKNYHIYTFSISEISSLLKDIGFTYTKFHSGNYGKFGEEYLSDDIKEIIVHAVK